MGLLEWIGKSLITKNLVYILYIMRLVSTDQTIQHLTLIIRCRGRESSNSSLGFSGMSTGTLTSSGYHHSSLPLLHIRHGTFVVGMMSCKLKKQGSILPTTGIREDITTSSKSRVVLTCSYYLVSTSAVTNLMLFHNFDCLLYLRTQKALRNYVPIVEYTKHYVGQECSSTPHQVYISTNDPEEVLREIDTLPKTQCTSFQFTVSNEAYKEVAPDASCAERYGNTIAKMAEIVIMKKSETFIGEFYTEMGRLVRSLRMRLSDEERAVDGGETHAAWGIVHPGPPGY